MMTIRRLVLVIGLATAAGGSVARAQDSAEVEGPRAERLRQMIEERFADRLTTELALTDDQAVKVRAVLATWAQKRRGLERDERAVRQRLASAMRPGVAADERTVTRLTDEILEGRLAYVQTFKDELNALTGTLSPIQKGQYILLRDRLMQRVQEIRDQRQGQMPAGRRRLRP
jgi:hypothetical protein